MKKLLKIQKTYHSDKSAPVESVKASALDSAPEKKNYTAIRHRPIHGRIPVQVEPEQARDVEQRPEDLEVSQRRSQRGGRRLPDRADGGYRDEFRK